MTPSENDVDLSRWFSPEELELCPNCGERKLIPSEEAEAEIRVCLSCGVVERREPRDSD
jgi:ribosomal protein L32